MAAEATASANTVILQPTTTTTSPNFITIETLHADKDSHKAGDVVYRITEDTAKRISDFLAMTGMPETLKTCQGQDIKRADTVEACLQAIERLAMKLADGGPDNLVQVAQQNVPANPGIGQPLPIGLENLVVKGIPWVVPVYRVVFEHARRRPTFDIDWSPYVLATSAAALAIATNWALSTPQSLSEIWIPREKLLMEFRSDRLLCPKDMHCVADECKGQEEYQNWRGGQPYSKMAVNFGCRCNSVAFGHIYEVAVDYMDKQNEWIEELIKRSEMPQLEPKCEEGEQKLADTSKKFEVLVGTVCNNHHELDTEFSDGKLEIDPEWSSLLSFSKKGGQQCSFDCRDMFMTFADAESCISSTGLQKAGTIETVCGKATYVTYDRNNKNA